LDDFINVIKTFYSNEGNDNTFIINKLINSLFNNNLYKNNTKLANILVNKIINLEFNIDSSEILLNIIQIDISKDEISVFMLIKKILNNLTDKEISELLKYLKNIDNLNIINKVEFIFRYILTEKEIKIFNNDKEIKNAIYTIFKDFTNFDKIIKYWNKKDLTFKENFHKCILELISFIIQLSENYSLDNEFYAIMEIFLYKIENEKLLEDIFKVLFFELFDTNEVFFDYIELNNSFINNYNIKPIDSDLYKYLCKLIEFILKFKHIKEIILELLLFLEKIYINYEKNKNTKNYKHICIFNHIFNSKKIIKEIFHYANEYQKEINIDSQIKYYMNDIFKGYNNLICFLYYHNQSPGFFIVIRENLKEKNNYKQKMVFIEEIINTICYLEEKKGDLNQNKIFYQNSLELIDIFYLSNYTNSNLPKDKDYENIFIKYFLFLKQNKYLFSPYLIPIDNYKKPILEYIFDLMIQFGFDFFDKFFINDVNIQNFILKKNIKEEEYQNDDFNNYLKTLKNKISEKPLIILIIETLLLEKGNNNTNYDKYLFNLINEIKINDIWNKLGKSHAEIKKIKSTKINDFSELITYFQRIKNKSKNIGTKSKSKNNLNNFDISENECSLKKICFFNKNQGNVSKSDIILTFEVINNIDNINTKKIYGTFEDIDLENIIICVKRDILLECSAYFYDVFFEDKNFKNLTKLFKIKFENNPKIILDEINNQFDKLNRPVKLKNYSNNKYAYPQLYLKPYTSFYNNNNLKITHPYYNINIIKKPSFPYFLPHYYTLKFFIDKEKEKKELFNEKCELIMKTNIICGNLIIKEKIIYFINNNDLIKEYEKNINYLFSSLAEDVRNKEKIIIIKIKDIEEIIARRFLYDYRACEIFLKNGKSYYFNFIEKENKLFKLFKEFEKFEELKDKIISNPVEYFKEQKYSEKCVNDEISIYQYLLYINKFSSRSYNDVNQYPIFPWIFRETSIWSYNNLKNLPKLRYLRYPISIGGKSLEDKKLEIEKAMSFYDSLKEAKFPYHFSSHYSTREYILSFLARILPYTEELLLFKKNKIDSFNRQLNSIDEFLTILLSNHDNRELIPEYFTTVEFYLNMNYVYFGFRNDDIVLINDVGLQRMFFNSIAQYAYYNRLILNMKIPIQDLNKPWYQEGVLNINSWIDLIFGYRQLNQPKSRQDLNLFGKYCYKQYINLEKISEKFNIKYDDENTIIKKIQTKKARILKLGQCPEVLFNKNETANSLLIKKFDCEEFLIRENIIDYFLNETKKNIVNFWVTEGKNNINYLYLLAYEEITNSKKNINPNNLSILIYIDKNNYFKKPDYIINIQEINLFSYKRRYEKKKGIKKGTVYRTQIMSESSLNNNIEETLDFKLTPKNCMFEICCDKRIYFFVGRNMDNSIKVYEIDIDKEKEGKLKYSIPMYNFVSCVYELNEYNFFTGHKNGKIYEWKITYNSDELKEKIINIEIIRDLISHKDSMICNICYIEKHNVLITSSNDGMLFIRKYFDFELLSVIETNEHINKFVYTDYDLLFLLTTPKGRKGNYLIKSKIHMYTLNGLLLESSCEDYFIDIEPVKNGLVLFNTINSNKLGIFGFNEIRGNVVEYDILSGIYGRKKYLNENIKHFTFQIKSNNIYILIGNEIIRKNIIIPDLSEKKIDMIE